MYVPDPTELMDAAIERNILEWEEAQKDVPEGYHRCPYCKQLFDYEPISVDASPFEQVCCFECLPEEAKKHYREFEKKQEKFDV